MACKIVAPGQGMGSSHLIWWPCLYPCPVILPRQIPRGSYLSVYRFPQLPWPERGVSSTRYPPRPLVFPFDPSTCAPPRGVWPKLDAWPRVNGACAVFVLLGSCSLQIWGRQGRGTDELWRRENLPLILLGQMENSTNPWQTWFYLIPSKVFSRLVSPLRYTRPIFWNRKEASWFIVSLWFRIKLLLLIHCDTSQIAPLVFITDEKKCSHMKGTLCREMIARLTQAEMN